MAYIAFEIAGINSVSVVGIPYHCRPHFGPLIQA